MSGKTWLSEFYPARVAMLPVTTMKVSEVIDHSLQKWKGLRPENLDKHGVFMNLAEMCIVEEDTPVLDISGHSCSLCELSTELNENRICPECPLFLVDSSCCNPSGAWGGVYL